MNRGPSIPSIQPVQPIRAYGATLTIPFALGIGGTQTIPAVGDYFYIVSLSGIGAINVQPNNDGDNPFFAGQGNHPSQGQYSQLLLRNQTGSAIAGIIVIGTDGLSGFIDKRIVLVAGAQGVPLYTEPTTSFPVGSDLTTIPANTTIPFPGTGQTGPRKQIVFQNLDAALFLRVLDGNGKIFYIIPPGESWTWQGQGEYQLFNPNGAAVAISAGEDYYVQ